MADHEKTIMLVCAAGMSTSMLVQRMQAAAEKDGVTAKIFATGASDADNKLADNDVDVLLLGPQVRFMKDQFTKKLADKDIPVDVIDMRAYGMMDGETVLQQAFKLIG
ncbi:PTS sugar transporter subunit IIB [Schleiferilactobacillus perolens]|uniref:PTS system, Lactose Cellobiose specific IIB subunit n=1 Tax=Schleiferilactobacillus perolens DSM 12744 TaxID=1423792 RepID=A0A0R1MUG8_9LACO|nr:PTS sugar transporter subunit IIB [Schleiferilactobacillus perolens]KRL08490.1 PTS system, Lactose Cellobiose specific IIB subunit [Schleiferilactobacillus perolens DSM 12744]MCI1891265.1 PTS sugar transporter subunit IIB [Schleiferilactobacillus harbinensis]MCI1912703.1 PTS sugar transporter subunit IIB [Schleiferilactobacillus harbinensis]MCI2172515.1 PTS sugar transporter subunit IIB [Schleiferilactobacillus perolens]